MAELAALRNRRVAKRPRNDMAPTFQRYISSHMKGTVAIIMARYLLGIVFLYDGFACFGRGRRSTHIGRGNGRGIGRLFGPPPFQSTAMTRSYFWFYIRFVFGLSWSVLPCLGAYLRL